MLVVCIIFGVLLDGILDNVLEDKSFIFLADGDKTAIMQQVNKELGKEKRKYFVTLVANVACGILSNFVFQMILRIFGLD